MIRHLTKHIHDIQHGDREHHHWHYLYKKRKARALGVSAKQMSVSQIFALLGSVVAGVLLEEHKATIALLSGAFIILPGIFDFDGTIGAVLSAKINHRLEDQSQKKLAVFMSLLWYAFQIAFIGGLVVGFFGGLFGALFFGASFIKLFMVSTGAIALSAIVGFPIVSGLSIFFRSRGVNPDDVVGPIEASLFNVLSVVSITVMVGLVL